MALGQKLLENFYISNINIPNHYPQQKICLSCLKKYTTYSNFLLRIVIWNIYIGDVLIQKFSRTFQLKATFRRPNL